jgi:hypothetical protein
MEPSPTEVPSSRAGSPDFEKATRVTFFVICTIEPAYNTYSFRDGI